MSLKYFGKLKKCDILIYFAVFLCGILIILYFTFFRNAQNAEAVTVKSTDGEFTYSLNKEFTERIVSNGYALTLRISGGSVWVEGATCPDKCCQNKGRISKSGESIVCLPAECIITLSGEGDADANAG